MIDVFRRHPMMTAVAGGLLLVALLGSVSIVPETSQGVVIRFGKPVRIVNRFETGERFGEVGAGLNAKIPFAEIDRVDRQARARSRHGRAAGAVDRPAPARGRRLRPLPGGRSLADVHRRPLRRPGRAGAEADPRLAASQRARQAAVRLPAQPRARGRDGEYPYRPQPRRRAIWRRSRRRPDQEGRSARRHAAPVGIRAHAQRAPAGSALDPRRGREDRADHPRRGRCRGGANLCRQLRQGPGVLRFLPGDAVLPDDLPRRRPRPSRRRPTSSCRRTTNI